VEGGAVPDEIEVLRLFRDETPGPSTDAWARARAAIAAARSEEQPARFRNVTGRAASRNATAPARLRNATAPGRHRMLAAAVVTGVAAAVAGLLAILLPGSPVTGPARIQTAAYVSRVERALSPSKQADLVGYARTILPPGSAPEPTANGLEAGRKSGASSPSSARILVQWSYGGTSLVSAFTATGQRVFDAKLATAPGGGPEITAVMYREATWWRAVSKASAGSAPHGCGPGLKIGPAGWPAAIRFELKCGLTSTDGRQRVDGIDAIKLTGQKGLLVTLWVDPRTYLPVRVVSGVSAAAGPLTRTDFRWLRPTPANLAHLNLQIPPGFRQVPPPSA
jgi:hypothetical protein